jgi:hypothetical protein
MGVALRISTSMNLNTSRKLSLQDLYPQGGRGNGTPIKDDGGGVNGDDHHGAQVEMSAAEKISLQDLYALALLC